MLSGSRVSICLLAAVFNSNFASAQNMQIIGSNSMAQACYRASTAAALSNTASEADVAHCTQALEHGKMRRSDMVATYVNRGVIRVALKDYSAAAKDYNRAIKMSPKLAAAYVNRGNLWFMANRYQQAIDDYDQALKLGFAQAHIALLNRGMVKEANGELTAARIDYSAALKAHRDWPVAEQKLARVNDKLKQSDPQRPPQH